MTYDEAYKIAQTHSDLPVIIDGPHAPTGKSTLCAKLRAEGRIAYEQWELEQRDIDFTADAYLVLKLDRILPFFKVANAVNSR